MILLKSILFVGDLNKYGRSFQRFRTFQGMDCKVTGLSSAKIPFQPGIDKEGKPSLLGRILWKLRLPPDTTGVNKKIREKLKKERYSIVWIDKGVSIKPKTLKTIKKIIPAPILVSCSEDDMFAFHNRSRYYEKGLIYYDIVFTTKTHNLSELKTLGARRVELFLDAADETLHRPVKIPEKDQLRLGADVGFIGMCEKDRAEKTLFLAERGVAVTIWGNGWEKWAGKHSNLMVRGKPIYGEDYVKAINATKINLGFLRKLNRDEVTSRSAEIPACGGFLLAERTKRHREFFEEDKEAVFFGSKEEVLNKVRYYLQNEKERKKIAEAGRLRCLKSGYTHKVQLKKMLNLAEKSAKT